jgi:hypothetical protein
MVAARAGEHAKVPELLAVAEQNDPWLEIAAGVSAEVAGDISAAVAAFRKAQEQAPVSPQGALAGVLADRLEAAHAIPPSPDRDATRRRFERLSDDIEPWVDRMCRDASTFQFLAVRLDAPEADALAPAFATISIRNNSPRPMALGAGKPINSRLLIAQSVTGAGRSLTNLASAEVVDAQRRLRLQPGEVIEVRYSLDEGPTGWLLETLAGSSGNVRLRVLQGFEVRPNGSREAGPGCLETMSGTFSRRILSEARLAPVDLARLLESPDAASLPRLLIAARAVLVLPPPDGAAPVIDALVRLYPRLAPQQRCLLVAVVPPASEVPELAGLDAVISAEQDVQVLGLALVTRAGAVDSPLIAAARASGDAALVRLADLHAARLGDNASCYATKGTGLVKPLRELLGVKVPLAPIQATPEPNAAAGVAPTAPR